MATKPLVTISVPAYKATDTIQRCVESLLAQTVEDIVVYVVNDGGPKNELKFLEKIGDPRLVVARSEQNVGRYAIDHNIAQVAESPWFAICDADDWVEPDWLESMLAVADGADVVMAPHWVWPLKGDKKQFVPLPTYTGLFQWYGHMGACLWRTDWVRQVHATNPYVRVGWDNVMTGMAHLLGNVQTVSKGTYNRVRTDNSLTTDPKTSAGSPLRVMTTSRLKRVWRDLRAHPERSPEIVERMSNSFLLTKFVMGHDKTKGSWALDRGALAELEWRLNELQPKVVLECGSGMSTVVLANYAVTHNAEVIVLEHDKRFWNQTRNLLRKHGLESAVDLRLAPLTGSPPMYDTELPKGIQFVLVDGPPNALGGRSAVFPAVQSFLKQPWEMWLDDSDRPEEQEAIQLWVDQGAKLKTTVPKATTVLGSAQFKPHRVDASNVVIGLLTGWRPALLAETLNSLPPGLLESAYVICVHDGGDEQTREVLSDYVKHIDELHVKTHPDRKMDPIGENMSLIAELADGKGEYFMMLEDDWRYQTLVTGWLKKAQELLADGVDQVRFRHVSDIALSRHMITKRPLSWESYGSYLLANAHLTVNPSLVKTDALRLMWPADGETAMQKNAIDNGLVTVAQLYPGVFTHIGDAESMRKLTQCKL